MFLGMVYPNIPSTCIFLWAICSKDVFDSALDTAVQLFQLTLNIYECFFYSKSE